MLISLHIDLEDRIIYLLVMKYRIIYLLVMKYRFKYKKKWEAGHVLFMYYVALESN